MATRKKSKRINRSLILAIAAAVVLAAGVLVYMTVTANAAPKNMEILLDNGCIAQGIVIEGIEVGGMTPIQARTAIDGKVQNKAEELKITLAFSDREEYLMGADIGVFPNADAVIGQAMLLSRAGGIGDRKAQIAAAASGQTVLQLGITYDEGALEQNIRNSALTINTEPVEPKVEFTQTDTSTPVINVIDGKAGIEVNVDQYVSLVSNEVTTGQFGTVNVPGTPKHTQYTNEDIRNNSVKIASFTTNYKHSGGAKANRVYNIVKIAGLLDGAVVMPGQEFSVNDHVGPRTEALGWRMAAGIENGIFTDQPGGGICQVSTTLYCALLKADLNVFDRRNHTIASAYVKRGFDATISTGGPDLKFRNETEWPVYLSVKVDEKKKEVIATVYGRPIPDGLQVELRNELVSKENIIPEKPIYVDDIALTVEARPKEVWRLYKDFTDADGKVQFTKETWKSTYRGNAAVELNPALITPTIEPTTAPPVTTAPTAAPTEKLPDSSTAPEGSED